MSVWSPQPPSPIPAGAMPGVGVAPLPEPEPGPRNGVGRSAIGPAGPSAHVEAFEKTWLSRGAVQSFRMRYRAVH
ncbi:hypothetical protein CABS01_00365 [Colletotrichum abscissum]|uniref:Uncharacterized protein n=1 Tax=Colletotrichum abscissum TaxID=1671311 RepID=A0A9P9XT82_9PEZI|nr:uncharacterized protein CABS01_00365 [Colletotrichum abscissum]KAI3559296.1 hypothetical protein CABS02_00271 [Colletotrichum abscissum]KAK1525276.1 hypothetical protein CABS01_00365 [Colletotrichum abscissum]